MPRFRSVKRALAAIAGLAMVFTALVGFAHTKHGRPLLAWMGSGRASARGCPFGYDVARTPAQKEAARRGFAATHASEVRAAARPALGFALDGTTRADAIAWASAHGVSCKTSPTGPDLDCADVPDAALPDAFRGAAIEAGSQARPRILSLWLTFGAEGKLVTAVMVREAPGAEPISATFTAIAAEVDRLAGPRSASDGDPSPAALGAGPLRQAAAEYRFRDYYAVLRATNMGDRFALTEEYRSLPDR